MAVHLFIKSAKKKKRGKKNKDGKKRRATWTEDEHRLFLDGYKAHPRDWSYIAKIVTSKTEIQIRTHAYSVFQRRRRVGTPLPSGFENMDHSWTTPLSPQHPQRQQVDAQQLLNEMVYIQKQQLLNENAAMVPSTRIPDSTTKSKIEQSIFKV